MIILNCIHCNELVIIEQINCAIFRHAVFKNNFIQINPHESKENCEKYIKNDLIYGCGKPFKIITDNETYKLIECDYI